MIWAPWVRRKIWETNPEQGTLPFEASKFDLAMMRETRDLSWLAATDDLAIGRRKLLILRLNDQSHPFRQHAPYSLSFEIQACRTNDGSVSARPEIREAPGSMKDWADFVLSKNPKVSLFRAELLETRRPVRSAGVVIVSPPAA